MRTFVWVVLMLCLAATAVAQNEPKSTPSQPSTNSTPIGAPGTTLGLGGKVAIGDQAPSFSLTSASGHERTLKSLRGDWVVLVFATDKREFAAFRKMNEKFAALPSVLLGVTRANPQTLATFAKKQELEMELLADVTGEISAIYGFYDSFAGHTKPGFLVIDRKGIVRLVVQGQSVPPDQVLSLAKFTIQGP